MNGEAWCQSHLADQELHQLLEKVDADLAQEACQKGCLFCRGKLHRADFDRKMWSTTFCDLCGLDCNVAWKDFVLFG